MSNHRNADGQHLHRIIATVVEAMVDPSWRGPDLQADDVREVMGGLIDALVAISVAGAVKPEVLVSLVAECYAAVDETNAKQALADVVARGIVFAMRYRRDKREGRLEAAAEEIRRAKVEGME